MKEFLIIRTITVVRYYKVSATNRFRANEKFKSDSEQYEIAQMETSALQKTVVEIKK